MRTRRRLFALVAAFAVAFSSLWPLVSQAGPRSHEIPNFICTQSGFQHPGLPASHDDKFHCPLCVTSVDSAPPVVAPAPVYVASLSLPAVSESDSSLLLLYSARSPPSRAPPQDS
ncbi:MAG TPA: DUF2946 family protein [Usitatibacter sp.]|nr:DUF2946 family protein [Usitatibacter sp.]